MARVRKATADEKRRHRDDDQCRNPYPAPTLRQAITEDCRHRRESITDPHVNGVLEMFRRVTVSDCQPQCPGHAQGCQDMTSSKRGGPSASAEPSLGRCENEGKEDGPNQELIVGGPKCAENQHPHRTGEQLMQIGAVLSQEKSHDLIARTHHDECRDRQHHEIGECAWRRPNVFHHGGAVPKPPCFSVRSERPLSPPSYFK